jgi:hypothetical protein
VTHENGAGIAGATLAITHTSINVERHARTNDVGRLSTRRGLDVGSYRIVVRASGFRTQNVEDLRLEVGRASVQYFTLATGVFSDEIVVRAGVGIAKRATFTLDTSSIA